MSKAQHGLRCNASRESSVEVGLLDSSWRGALTSQQEVDEACSRNQQDVGEINSHDESSGMMLRRGTRSRSWTRSTKGPWHALARCTSRSSEIAVTRSVNQHDVSERNSLNESSETDGWRGTRSTRLRSWTRSSEGHRQVLERCTRKSTGG